MNVLVVAFDGLDYDLIEKYDVDNVKQDEFGLIDNDTGMYQRSTYELFASFLTGRTHEEHSVEGMNVWKNEKIGWFEKKVEGNYFFGKFKGLRMNVYDSINSLGEVKGHPSVENLEAETVLEKIHDSEALFFPSYNPSLFPWHLPLQKGKGADETAEFYEREHNWRKKKLFEALDYDFGYNLLMCHFHKPDVWQHLFAHPIEDERKIERVYDEMDDLAGEILEEADNYDMIIFMSDHGLPGEGSHNKNAFYSCNKKLFGDKKPHITDFHDKIIENAG